MHLICSLCGQNDSRHVGDAKITAKIPKDRVLLNSRGPDALTIPSASRSARTKTKLRAVDNFGL